MHFSDGNICTWFTNCDFHDNANSNCLAGQAPLKSKGKATSSLQLELHHYLKGFS